MQRNEPNREESFLRGQIDFGADGGLTGNIKLEYADFKTKGQPREVFGDVGAALQATVQAQRNGRCTVLEMLVTQELGYPFRRDALSKPVRYFEKYKSFVYLKSNDSKGG